MQRTKRTNGYVTRKSIAGERFGELSEVSIAQHAMTSEIFARYSTSSLCSQSSIHFILVLDALCTRTVKQQERKSGSDH